VQIPRNNNNDNIKEIIFYNMIVIGLQIPLLDFELPALTYSI
jgi:hypothetical protein